MKIGRYDLSVNRPFTQQAVRGAVVLSAVFGSALAQTAVRREAAELQRRRLTTGIEVVAGPNRQIALPNHLFSYSFAASSFFSYPESGGLTVDAVEKGKSTLPAWVNLERSGMNLLGRISTRGEWTRVRVAGNKAYVADGLYLQIIDISIALSPTLLSTYTLPEAIVDLDAGGNVVYAAVGSSGLHIIDASDPAVPILFSAYDTPGEAYAVHVVDGLAYIADFGVGLQIVDVCDPSLPALVGSYPYEITFSNVDVSVGKQVAYLLDWSNLIIIDVSDPSSPVLITDFYTQYSTAGVHVADNFAYLGEYDLTIIDISNPSFPVEVSTLSIPSPDCCNSEIYVVNNLAYIASSTGGLTIADVTNPSSPFFIGNYDTPGDAYGVHAVGHVAYVAYHTSGLHIIEIGSILSGIPDQEDIGNYEIDITATDPTQNSVSLSFSLQVQGPPTLSGTLPNQLADINTPFSHFINQSAFPDPNSDIIFFSYKLANQSSLPTWLSFSPIGIFSGTPSETDRGNYTVEISAFDGLIPATATTKFSLFVEHFPVVSNPIPNLPVDVDTLFSFTVPQETFTDADEEDILTYTTSSLPFWLSFNSTTLEFSGTPSMSDSGTKLIELQATDAAGASASTTFLLEIEKFPDLQHPIPDQIASVGHPYAFALPANTFISHDGLPLSYFASKSNGDLLPNWLDFVGARLEFQGTPLPTDKEQLSLKLTATDPKGGWVETLFTLNVIETISEETSRVGGTFLYLIPPDMISNPLGAVFYTVTLGDRSPLPTWLLFDTQANTLAAVPPNNSEGTYDILIVASDGVQEPVAGAVFLTVEKNAKPQVANGISTQFAQVGQIFRLVVPDNTFKDPNGDPLALRAAKTNGRSLPNWLSFADKTLEGKPGPSDTGAFRDKVVPIKICASDGDEEACSSFDLSVHGTSTEERNLRIVGPTLSLAAFAVGWVKKRGFILNPLNSGKYDKGTRNVPFNAPFSYTFQANRSDIVSVEAFLGKEALLGLPIPLNKWTKLLTFDKPLSEGTPLPSWLSYNDATNKVITTRDPNIHDKGIYTIRAYGSGSVILEEIKFDVGGTDKGGTELGLLNVPLLQE